MIAQTTNTKLCHYLVSLLYLLFLHSLVFSVAQLLPEAPTLGESSPKQYKQIKSTREKINGFYWPLQ